MQRNYGGGSSLIIRPASSPAAGPACPPRPASPCRRRRGASSGRGALGKVGYGRARRDDAHLESSLA